MTEKFWIISESRKVLLRQHSLKFLSYGYLKNMIYLLQATQDESAAIEIKLNEPVGEESTAVLFIVTVELFVAGSLRIEAATAVESSELFSHAVAAIHLIVGLVCCAVLKSRG